MTKIEKSVHSTCIRYSTNNPEQSSSRTIEVHEPCGYGLTVVEMASDKGIRHSVVRDVNCMTMMTDELRALALEGNQNKRRFMQVPGTPLPIPNNNEICWICECNH